MWASALLCVFLESWAWLCALVLWGVGLVILVVLWRRPPGAWLGLVAVALVASAAAATAVAFAAPERDHARQDGGRVIEVVADVTSAVREGRDGRLWFDGAAVALGVTGDAQPTSVAVRIGVEVPEAGAPAEWVMGARLRVRGQAKAGEAGERAALVIFGRGDVELIGAPGAIFAQAGEVRRLFVERALRLPEPGAGLLPGLAVGDTRAVSEELNQAMLTSGLSHLTAVSGANCAIVVGAVYGVAALLRGGRRLRIGLATVALIAFVILVTPEPSVIRAAVMAGLGMLTLLLGRPAAGVGVLCLAVSLILVSDPWLGATPGFALSAVATAALIALARPVSRGLARWMPEPLALGVAVPLAAQLACGPVLALFAEQQSIVGVVANMLAAPAAPVATVIGLLACLTLPIPPLADLFAASAWLPAAWIATTATVSSSLPGAYLRVEPGLISAAIVLVLTIAVVVLLVRGTRGAQPHRVARAAAAALLAVAVGLGAGRLLLTETLAPLTQPGDWSLAFCDVGQGDAILARSAGRVALIDTGPDPEALSACLRALGITHIDLLVLTHFDLDHAGGVAAVTGAVGLVLHGPVPSAGDKGVRARLAASGARLAEAFAGQHGGLGDAQWRVLWPLRDSRVFPAGNDASVALEIAGGGIPRTLLLGDLSASPQGQLLRTGTIAGPYAVVKVAHHGSRDQDSALYAAAHAAVAVFTVGENDYGHPHPAALTMVAGAHIFRTDEHGRILLRLDAGELTAWTERSAAPAAPAGESAR